MQCVLIFKIFRIQVSPRAASLPSLPHFSPPPVLSACRTRVSRPAGIFDTSREEICYGSGTNSRPVPDPDVSPAVVARGPILSPRRRNANNEQAA